MYYAYVGKVKELQLLFENAVKIQKAIKKIRMFFWKPFRKTEISRSYGG
jgi:hypothetical protein